MRSIINSINEFGIDVVGFDIDGTLYDEFSFIYQAYKYVASTIGNYLNVATKEVHNALCEEWLKHGSSASIFQNVIQKYGVTCSDSIINECIDSYRNSKFTLQLSYRAIFLFEYLKSNNIGMFIVTDGNSTLQRRKIKELGLNRWFQDANIAISGDYGSWAQKPSTFLSNKIHSVNQSKRVLYLGDRNVDMLFAQKCGFYFIKVSNMQKI